MTGLITPTTSSTQAHAQVQQFKPLTNQTNLKDKQIKPKGVRLASLELLRFVAAIFIISAHFEQIVGTETPRFSLAFVYVEFFFMITGYYMMSGALKNQAPAEPLESVIYSFKKAQAIYLAYFSALVFTFIINISISAPVSSVSEALQRLFHFKWEFFYLQMLGFNPSPGFNVDYLLGPGWYLSAMFIALVPAYFLARQFKNTFSGIIAPVFACSIYYYMIQNYETLDVGNETLPFAMLGVLRALAGLFFGAFVFAIYQRAAKTEQSKTFKKICSIAEYVCYLLIIFMPLFTKIISSADAIVYLAIFAFLIIIGNLNISRFDIFLNLVLRKLCLYLGKLSLYVYLFHWGILLALQSFFSGLSGFTAYAIFFSMVMATSVLIMFIIEVVIKKQTLF